jgi:hypothetical protein
MVQNPIGILIGRILVVLLLPSLLWAGEASSTTAPSTRMGAFLLTVDGPLVSLRAQEASLRAILKELGRRLGIEVTANISWEQTLTLAFDRLTVADALERFRAYVNIVSITDSTEAQAKIRRIIAMPIESGEGTGKPGPRWRADAPRYDAVSPTSPRPAPFHFEFDPVQHEKKPQ